MVPTVFKLAKEVNVVLEVAVMLLAVVAVVAFPFKFPVTFPIKPAVIFPAIKFPLASLLTIVFGVFASVAALANNSAARMFAAVEPPTVFTVGDVAIPPKSPANWTLPFTVVEASGVAALVVAVTKAVVATCVVLVPAAAVGAIGTPVKLTSTMVLLVIDSVPAKVAMVPVVGNVISVAAVLLKIVLKLPAVVKLFAVKILPPSVMVLIPLFTPVPPKVPAMACVKLSRPSKGLPYIFFGAASFVVVLALPAKFPVTFPVKLAVIFPAIKLPLASLFTIVLAVFASVAALANRVAVLIAEAVEPPTELTVGDAAIPAKSPAS